MKKLILLAGLAVVAGAANADFVDDFEGANVWTTSEGPGFYVNPWVRETGSGNQQSGQNNWFFADLDNISDSYLDSPLLVADLNTPALTFGRQYDLEADFDGVVVEVNVNGGGFVDIGPANLVTNGYDGPISTFYQSPIGGRDAFNGFHMGYLTTTGNIQVSAGDTFILRFRGATDNSVSAFGFALDDVDVRGASVVPEPGTFVAIGIGLAGLALARRRK
ncbi:MAG: PEP-CTERM sorting domain-containing protein [Armatimonadota bacterium]|nr:PEP-CTERM sorting domain-containing protein [Armatimonadota bacterium]